MWPLPTDSGKGKDEISDKGKQRATESGVQMPTSAQGQNTGQAEHASKTGESETGDKPFLSEDVIMPSIAANVVKEVEGLAKNRHDAIRDTPLTGVQEHKINVPSENLALEETIRAAASSS